MSFEDDEKADAIARFMDWLKDKPEDAWFECVDRFASDDDAGLTLRALVEHPRCTKQVAAHAFWWMSPDYAARRIMEDGRLQPEIRDADMIIDRVLRNWRDGLYQVGEVEFEAPSDQYRRDFLKGGSADPLNIPADLLGNFTGRKIIVGDAMPPFGSPYFWDAYSSGGLEYASRPSEYEERFAAERKARARPQPARAIGLALIAFSVLLWLILRNFMTCPELSVCRVVLLQF